MRAWTDKGHFINGAWKGANGLTAVENPATEEIVAHISRGTIADIDGAVAAARAALPRWSQTQVSGRAEYLARITALVEARQDDLADCIATEVGMPRKLAKMIQVGLPLQTFRHAAEYATHFPWESEVGNSRVIQEAVGVVAAITPWNYPLHQIAAKIAPALAAGCTVVLKPADLAPLNALLLAELVQEAGLPPGVFNVVTGAGSELGARLATHPDVDMISFTGSTGVGASLAGIAAKQIKRVSLELGGKSAAVVLDDADLEKAVKTTVGACLLNSGQTCSAISRLIVPKARMTDAAAIARDAVSGYVVGDPFDPATRLGPVISAQQRDNIWAMIQTAESDGAELVTGGVGAPQGRDIGYFVQPTVYSAVHPDSSLAQQEVFGPVLAIIGYETEDEAVEIANNSDYGLSGAVWSASNERATDVARRIRTGQIDINGGRFNILAPFGGFKKSGYGRELGPHGFDEFTETKSLQY